MKQHEHPRLCAAGRASLAVSKTSRKKAGL